MVKCHVMVVIHVDLIVSVPFCWVNPILYFFKLVLIKIFFLFLLIFFCNVCLFILFSLVELLIHTKRSTEWF